MTMEGTGGVVASSLKTCCGMVDTLGLMVKGGYDTSYSSMGDGWLMPRTGWILARIRLDPAADTGVRGPPEELSDMDEKVGEGVSGKASLAK